MQIVLCHLCAFVLLASEVNCYWERPPSTKISRGKAGDKCEFIVTIPNGRVVYEDDRKLNHIGKRIRFICKTGYKLDGVSSALCQPKYHTWSEPVPTCIEFKCPHLQGIQFGRIVEHNNLPGKRAVFECDKGYRAVGGSTTIYCSPTTAEWSNTPPMCVSDKCPPIIVFRNGQVLDYDNNRNSKIEFVCDPNYKLDGPSSIKCEGDGPSWSAPAPKCVCKDTLSCLSDSALQPKCDTIVSIPNGRFWVEKGDGVSLGSRIQVRCNDGWLFKHELEEVNETESETRRELSMRCKDDGWDIPVPECIATHCPKREIIENGYILNATKNYAGGNIKVRCYKGYVTRGGESTVRCNHDGTWSSNTCCFLPQCEDLLHFPNGFVEKYSNVNSFANGSRSRFRCDQGYSLVGIKSNKCTHKGEWQNEHPKCVYGFATCVAHGDPHYRSYDQQKMTFMGTCTYTLSSTCGNAAKHGLMEFNVEGKNFPGLSVTKKPVTFTEYVTVDIGGYRIKLGPGINVVIGKAKKEGNITVMEDGEQRTLPVMGLPDMHDLTITKSGRFLQLRTAHGFVVRIDEYSKADITVPAEYSDIGLCGVCGNFDMMPSNDLVTAQGDSIITNKYNPKKDKYELKYDWVTFGNSYVVPGPGSEPGCKQTTEIDEEDCDDPQIEAKCKITTDMNGLFKSCLHSMGIPWAEEKYLSCKFDACLVDEDVDDMICSSLADFADSCAEMGHPVAWRNKTFCPLPCGENEEYKPLTTACPATCSSIKESIKNCPEEDREGCACIDDYVLSDDKCVHKKECGCTDDLGRYFPTGESYVNGDCTAVLTCEDDGTFGSTPLPPCHEDAVCGYKDGKRGCKCKDGYEGDGINKCEFKIDPGVCLVAGDPFYTAYDNGRIEHQGYCSYYLSKPCDSEDDDWSVVVENKQIGERSYAHRLHVHAYQHVITLEEFSEFKVDGQDRGKLESNQINVTHEGAAVVVKTDFGLKVSFDGRGFYGRHQSHITMSNGSYYGKLCGICGNWNGDIVDDFWAKDKPNIIATGKDVGDSWITDDPCPPNQTT